MKKLGFLVFSIIFLWAAAVKIQPYLLPNYNVEIPANVETKDDKLNPSSTIPLTRDQIFQGDLLLVNKQYPVHEAGVKTDIVSLIENEQLVQGYSLLDNDIQLSASVTQKFVEMIQAAKKDGIEHFIISSGYRNFEEQERLYIEKGSDYALPAGYSEHNLGLSLDIGSSQMEMNKAKEGKWLTSNAWKHGFVLRYPKDKTAITGIQYEPWHFRYVGIPHSVIMQKNHFTLEEYSNYLKKQQSISIKFGDRKYEVYYYPVTDDTTVTVPAYRELKVDGNNTDGVIVTLYK